MSTWTVTLMYGSEETREETYRELDDEMYMEDRGVTFVNRALKTSIFYPWHSVLSILGREV